MEQSSPSRQTKMDKRWAMVDAEMRRHGYANHALLETLHAVQGAYGYLDRDNLSRVATSLRLPLSKVYGVATFYHHFSLNPIGQNTCVICTGTACYIKDATGLVKEVEERFNMKLGETTNDGKLTILPARCVGACGIAPVVVINGDTSGKLKPGDLTKKLEEVLKI